MVPGFPGHELLARSVARIGVGAVAALAIAAAPASAAASAPTPSIADAPLGYLLRTDDEFPLGAALFLRAAGQLTGDSVALEIAEIRRLGFTEAEIGALAPLFASELTLFVASAPPRDPTPESRLPGDPHRTPSAAGTSPAPPSGCLERAARCELDERCVAAAMDVAAAVGAEQSALWLLVVRWRSCSSEFDVGALSSRLAGRLLADERRDGEYSTTALLRLATLGQLGFADRIERESVSTILEARSPAGCWGSRAGGPCHPHPTALALWVLALAERAGRGPAEDDPER